MKIKLWSDLHLELRENEYDHIWIPKDEDKETILILAGDIAKGTGARVFIEHLCQHFKHVIYVHGNHEYYDGDHPKTVAAWQELETNGDANFHFLYNDWRIIDGVRFLGGTMWTNFDDGDPMIMAYAHRVMNDYADTWVDGKRMTPDYVLAEHDKFMNFFLKKLEEPYDGKTVVVTHHSPGDHRRLKRTNRDRTDFLYFACLEEIIAYHGGINLWCHGHTHRNWDYMIPTTKTRVVCNPYGYWMKATNRGFDRDINLDLEYAATDIIL